MQTSADTALSTDSGIMYLWFLTWGLERKIKTMKLSCQIWQILWHWQRETSFKIMTRAIDYIRRIREYVLCRYNLREKFILLLTKNTINCYLVVQILKPTGNNKMKTSKVINNSIHRSPLTVTWTTVDLVRMRRHHNKSNTKKQAELLRIMIMY